MNKIKFITFSDGSDDYRAAGMRLGRQASESGWFDEINVFHDEYLKDLSEVWYRQHSDFLHNNRRGFGYWIWKPFIISENLKKLPKDSILVYADAGFEMNGNGKDRFFEYIKLAEEFDLFGFHLEHPISKFTKGNLLNYFGIDHQSPILSLKQMQANLMFIKATSQNIAFFNSWSEICCSRLYSLVDDSKSSHPNCNDFIDHRHDQSIFTLLCTLNRHGFFIPHEDYFPELFSQGLYPIDKPFLAFRNRTGAALINS